MDKHLNNGYKMVYQKVFKLKKLRKQNSTNTAMLVYKLTILPFFEYRNFLINACCQRKQDKTEKSQYQTLKPIFHQNAKYLVSGPGVGTCPRRQGFALGIPTCWYLKCEKLPTPNLKFALAPTLTCRFHLRLYPTQTQFPVEYGLKDNTQNKRSNRGEKSGFITAIRNERVKD